MGQQKDLEALCINYILKKPIWDFLIFLTVCKSVFLTPYK